jgi:hypothetical protein
MIGPNMLRSIAFFIKEKIDDNIIVLSYVMSGKQVADCLIKGLGLKEGELACNKMEMIDIYCHLEGECWTESVCVCSPWACVYTCNSKLGENRIPEISQSSTASSTIVFIFYLLS